MGLSAVAGHTVMLVAMFSAGTVFVTSTINAYSDGIDAQNDAFDRHATAADEDLTLTYDEWQNGPKRVVAEWTNDGGDEVDLAQVTLLVAGVITDTSSVERFQVQQDPTSSIWMPGETLEVWVKGQGDVDLTIIGPHGAKSYRRA